jgi:predicted transcriptional regulator
MSELEMEIGRTLGASAFFIYQTLKYNPKSSLKDLAVETGISDRQIKVYLKHLLDCNVITRQQVFLRYCKGFIYQLNEEKETWKFH